VSATPKETTLHIVVDAERAGQRLDQLLAASGAVVSRARAQALVRAGHVRVGNVPRKASYMVRAGDVVDAAVAAAPDPAERTALPRPERLPLEVLYEDAELIAINKAAGVVVHPAPGHWEGTLVSAILYHLGGAPAGSDPTRPGIVHRLDKDTSGVLLVAKTADAHELVASQFRRRTIRKRYVAVAWGRMPLGEGTIDRPIGRHPTERKRMSVRTRRGRQSATRYRVVESHAVASVLHQLRVHLAAVGHPIVGDRVYGRSRDRRRGKHGTLVGVLGAFPRQALHAEVLGLVHPRTGEPIELKAPLPDDMQRLLGQLRRGEFAAA
jgi:23S rRNA pseudouridine1911/1915/1917 synthase